MSDEGVDPTETQPESAFGVSKRTQRARKTTEFYSPTSSAPKKQKKMSGKSKKKKKIEKSVITGRKRKAIDVPVEQSKKRKVAEPAGSKRKLDLESGEDEAEEPRKKRLPDLIKV